MKQISKIFLLSFLLLFSFTSLTSNVYAKKKCLSSFEEMFKKQKKAEKKQLEKELKGKEKKIGKTINKILKKHNKDQCLKDDISMKIFKDLAKGKTDKLFKHMKKEEGCFSDERDGSSALVMAEIIKESEKQMKQYKEIAINKVQQTHNITRLGKYADGSDKNSCFDIVKDKKKINKLLFSMKDGKGGNCSKDDLGFDDSIDDPDSDDYDDDDIVDNGTGTTDKENKFKNNRIKVHGIETEDQEITNTTEIPIYETGYIDGNQYPCSSSSGSELNKESFEFLTETSTIDGQKNKLPGGNKINPYYKRKHNFTDFPIPLNPFTPPENGTDPTDNTEHKVFHPHKGKFQCSCESIICIIIKFHIKKFSPLQYAGGNKCNPNAGNSLQNILEKADKNIKNSANTNHAQLKLTTNNFEMSYKDSLNLPSLLHIGKQTTSRAAIIVEKPCGSCDDENDAKKDVQNMLDKRYKQYGLNPNKPNDINRFKQLAKEYKSANKTTGLPATRMNELLKKLNEINTPKGNNDYASKLQQKLLKGPIGKNFSYYEQFMKHNRESSDYMKAQIKKYKNKPKS